MWRRAVVWPRRTMWPSAQALHIPWCPAKNLVEFPESWNLGDIDFLSFFSYWSFASSRIHGCWVMFSQWADAKRPITKKVHRVLLHMCKDFPHDVSREDYTLKQWGSTRLPSAWRKFNATSTSDGAQDVGQQELSFIAGGGRDAKCPSRLGT